jgi:hypothetical protein
MASEFSEIQAASGRLWTRRAIVGVSIATLFGATATRAAPNGPATPPLRPPVVFDPMTALAIDGYDPVGYFTDGAARPGLPTHEIRDGRLFWRFLNEGNMAAFRANPEIYEPIFGGYCPYALSRRLPTPGNPAIFEIFEGKLVFFFSAAHRLGFRRSPSGILAEASAHWPDMRALVVGRG